MTRHAQFAVTQVAHEAKHWLATACDGYNLTKKAITSALRSMIQVYERMAAALANVWLLAPIVREASKAFKAAPGKAADVMGVRLSAIAVFEVKPSFSCDFSLDLTLNHIVNSEMGVDIMRMIIICAYEWLAPASFLFAQFAVTQVAH